MYKRIKLLRRGLNETPALLRRRKHLIFKTTFLGCLGFLLFTSCATHKISYNEHQELLEKYNETLQESQRQSSIIDSLVHLSTDYSDSTITITEISYKVINDTILVPYETIKTITKTEYLQQESIQVHHQDTVYKDVIIHKTDTVFTVDNTVVHDSTGSNSFWSHFTSGVAGFLIGVVALALFNLYRK